MSLQRKMLYGFGIAVLAVIAVGVFLPSAAVIERQSAVDAWPATVFVLVDDTARSAEWSPWIGAAAAAMPRVSGPANGVGAALAWDGPRPGRRTIIESTPNERVVARLELDGVPGTSIVRLERTDASSTRVRWQLELDLGNDLLARYRALFRGKALAHDVDSGLAELKTLAENLPRADFSDLAIERLDVESSPIAYRPVRSRPDPAAISNALGKAYFDVLAFVKRHGLSEAGPPLAINRGFSGPELVLDAAIPVRGMTEATPPSDDDIHLGYTYAGAVVRATHTGPYRELARTHRQIAAWLAAHDIERNGDAWEVYVSDPARTPDAERTTLIYYPVRSRQP